MNTETRPLSDGFQRLYCDATVFEGFNGLHPISFSRVLPFQAQDPVADDARLIAGEEAHLASRNDDSRRDVVEAYSHDSPLKVLSKMTASKASTSAADDLRKQRRLHPAVRQVTVPASRCRPGHKRSCVWRCSRSRLRDSSDRPCLVD